MATSFTARTVLTAALGTIFAFPGGAQLGHVVDAQKISDTSGGFTALLDEEDQFGRSIVNLGDLDGDGVTDLLVGAHTDDDGGIDQGAVYVLFLHPNGFVKSWTKIGDLSGNFGGWLDPGDQFGRAAACLGDLDLDGVVDVVVSSNYDDDGGANKGAVYVLFLNADGTVGRVQKVSQTQGGFPATLKIHDELGRSITPLGDMDGDGVMDIVVGTPEDDDGGTNTGALHILFLNRSGTVKAYRRISRSTDGLRLKPGDWFGHCSANLGDFDRDGVTDLAVGAVLDDDGGVNQGSLWILLLRADGSVKSACEINELYGGFTAQLDDIDQFGTSVMNLGDLDGDGVTDIAVGAVKDDDGGNEGNPDADVGAVYVLFLNPDCTVKSWVKISDTSGDLPYSLDQYDWFGSALCRLGGSSGDGLFNLAIGCRNDDDGSPNRGAVYLTQLNDGTAPAADFVASRTLGVAPLTVSFEDNSTGEVTAWLWSFGTGPQSSLRDPVKTFDAPGIYDVQLTARGPKGRDTELKRGLVTVVSGPLADFMAAPTEGTAPLDVAFTDLSEGEVSAWWWDFGDGASSSQQSPQHVYAAGTYAVSLTVTGPAGTDTRTRPALVVAADRAPVADFSLSPETGPPPLAVQFDDLSTGEISAWTWDLGDGATASTAAPAHVYSSPGTYTVSLTVAGPYGSSSRTRAGCVVVQDPVPAALFSVSPDTGYAPLAAQFTDLSTGDVTSWSWSFGDGGTSSERNPQHVFEDSGSYAVGLTVAGPLGSDFETRMLVVDEPPPIAEFLAPSTTGFAPFTAQFTDQSSGIVTLRQWDFGDGASGAGINPQHTYVAPGTYTVTLAVSGPYGSDSEVKADLIHVLDPAPAADFGASPTSGVAPLVVRFTDLSAGQISSWSWDFGDGAGSSERDPEHVYAAPGTYDARLTASGPAGSDQELEPGFVVVSHPPPAADFGAAPTAGPAPLAVQFSDLSAGAISAWSWEFGDGSVSLERDPQHVYAAPGTYGVRLTASGPGGSSVFFRPGLIEVVVPPPVAALACGPQRGFVPLPVAFTDLSSGAITSRLWTFGDGTSSTLKNPVKTYTRPGTYTVSLTVGGPGGTSTATSGELEMARLPLFGDGGFERQKEGSKPRNPWAVTAGTAVIVQPTSVASDQGMPIEGAQWCEIGADGSSAATPPSNPYGQGQLPVGAAGIKQTFAFQPLGPWLLFDAAFVLGEPPASPLTNDFMSVDLTDGNTSWNVFHADTFASFPLTSAKYGLPMTEVRRVAVDLRRLFPGATAQTRLTLRISVGNGGDGLDPSRGYVDGFRLVPAATAAFRNGTGRNAARYTSSPAVLGGDWTVQVDSSGHPGALGVLLSGTGKPSSGTFKPGGELLVGGPSTFSRTWPSSGGLDAFSIALPLDAALIGRYLATQVTITGGATELCNAYDLILGF